MCHWAHTAAMKTSRCGRRGVKWSSPSEGESLESGEEINNALSCAFSTLDGWLGWSLLRGESLEELSPIGAGGGKVCKEYSWRVFSHLAASLEMSFESSVSQSRQHERRLSWRTRRGGGGGETTGLQETVSSVHKCNRRAVPGEERALKLNVNCLQVSDIPL